MPIEFDSTANDYEFAAGETLLAGGQRVLRSGHGGGQQLRERRGSEDSAREGARRLREEQVHARRRRGEHAARSVESIRPESECASYATSINKSNSKTESFDGASNVSKLTYY